MRHIISIFLLIVAVTACEYELPYQEDQGAGGAEGFTTRLAPVRVDGAAQGVSQLHPNLIYQTDVLSLLVDTATLQFSMPADLSCDGVDNNNNGETDEDCHVYLEKSGDAEVMPGYYIARSPRFKLKGYYWVESE